MNAREPGRARRWRGGLAAALVGAGLSACASHPPSPPPIPATVPATESSMNATAAPQTTASEVAPPLPPPSGAAAVPCVAPPATTSTRPVKRRNRRAHEPPANEELPQPQAAQTAKPPRGTEIKSEVGEIGSSLTSILGKRVEGPDEEDLGRVVDVLADSSGRVRVAIIDFGGFLGVGSRRIAVDWPLLRFDVDAGKSSLILSVSREKLQAAPEYKDAARPRVLLPASVAASGSASAPETKK